MATISPVEEISEEGGLVNERNSGEEGRNSKPGILERSFSFLERNYVVCLVIGAIPVPYVTGGVFTAGLFGLARKLPMVGETRARALAVASVASLVLKNASYLAISYSLLT